MLHIDRIHTYYGESHILQGVSLHVPQGKIAALLGRNGAGKSTTINSIIGFTPPKHGEIRLQNTPIARLAPHRIAQYGVGLVPQGRGIFPTLAVKENIILAARPAQNDTGWTLARVLDTFPALKKRLNNLGNQLSGGEQQMLALARALMMNPKLLLLDEPSEGLAPLIVAEIGHLIQRVRNDGISVLLVEQNVAMALEIADIVYVMNKGVIVFTGSPNDLRQNNEVVQRYLGV